MKVLKDILYKVNLVSVSGTTDLEVHDIAFDSRQVSKGAVFIAVRGTVTEGHDYMDIAVESGAIAVVCETLPDEQLANTTYVQVKDSQKALGIMASNFFGNPSAKLKLVGVTGTNGKTTTATLLWQLFSALGYKSGLLSTVQNMVGAKVHPATHTTPNAIAINKLLLNMVNAGCTHCFMEVSSHAIVQERIAGLQFAGGAFTNISHDHLDYHGTFDNYIRAKKAFFDQLGSDSFAIVNKDDRRGLVMLQNTKAVKYTYAIKSEAAFRARILSNSVMGLELEIDERTVWLKMMGRFNAYNILLAYAIATLLGEDNEEVLTQLSLLDGAKGRFERFMSETNVAVIIDYAHTPDALQNVLETIDEIRSKNEQVITVVGCGGDRDAAKRPVMADIAARLSDRVILTSDNPRSENPEVILDEMQKGISAVHRKKMLRISDRREAIRTACSLAGPGDILLVAGKGHETYQEVNGERYPFDDLAVTREMLKTLEK